MRIFQSLNDEGRTIIMITHEKENIQYLKRVITFRDGSILEDREVYDRKVLNIPEDLPEHRAIHED
jgi:putative ABC transport system ATP-binding protein